MDFSSISFCVENKKRTFQDFMSGTLKYSSSNMGLHKAEEMPFVELTGHKLEDTIVHSPFGITNLNFAKSFNFRGKMHNFTDSTKHFMKSENMISRKDIYNPQFSAIAFTHLVGGFVGSKSQLGSSSREACQVWDLIFNKISNFCATEQSPCQTMLPNNPQNYYNLENKLTRDVVGSICQKAVDASHIILKNTADVIQKKLSGNPPTSESFTTKISPSSTTEKKLCDATTEFSKQSYAEVAKTFAVVQKQKMNDTQQNAVPRKRKSIQDKMKFNKGQFNSINKSKSNCINKDNFKLSSCSQTQNRGKQMKFPFEGNKTFHNYKHKKSQVHSTEKKAEIKQEHTSIPELPRIDTRKNSFRKNNKTEVQMTTKQCPVQNNEEKFYNYCKMVPESCVYLGSKIRTNVNSALNSMKEISKPFVEKDLRAVFACDDSSSVKTSADEQLFPSPENLSRGRYVSECSTDSDDSFVIFDSNVDCNAVILAMTRSSSTDSEVSEDGYTCQLSDDDDDDTETVIGLDEVNNRWQRDYSAYSKQEKEPAKVQFAENRMLQTVHHMFTWNYAYHAARCGPWEQMARDRERFNCRIKRSEPMLAAVLTPEHRHHIWKKLRDGKT